MGWVDVCALSWGGIEWWKYVSMSKWVKVSILRRDGMACILMCNQ